MLYPISPLDNKNSITFKKQFQRIAKPNTDKIATINSRLQGKINVLKSTYLEIINKVNANASLASKIASEFDNIKIENAVITVLGDDNKSIKLSLFEVGFSKLFRIKFFENKELKNIITIDNYKLVEQIDKNDIIYSKEDSVNTQEITSTIENVYNSLDEPFLELRKYIKANDFTRPFIETENKSKYKSILEKKEVGPGVTTDMLPISRVIPQEEKLLFSYAAFIDKNKPNPLIKENTFSEQKEDLSEFSTKPKRKQKSVKVADTTTETNKNESPTPRRKRKQVKTTKTIVKSSGHNNSSTHIRNTIAGQLPRTVSAKIIQIENLYQEIDSIMKNFSQSKLIQLKQGLNIDISKNDGLHFNEPNGDKLSVIKLNRDDSKTSNLLEISFNNKDKTKNVFVIIDNAKKLVSSDSKDKQQIFDSKLSYQTQNEVNSVAYRGDFQATIDKITNKLLELKKSLFQLSWKTKQNAKAENIKRTHSIEKKDLEVKPESPANVVLPKSLKIEDKSAEMNLTASIDAEKIETVENDDVKKVLDTTITNLENIVTEKENNSDTICKFNKLVDKIKHAFEKFLSKSN